MLYAIVESLLFHFYVQLHMYFDTEKNCLKSTLELTVLTHHLVVEFCIIIFTIYSTGSYVKCLKTSTPKAFPYTAFTPELKLI